MFEYHHATFESLEERKLLSVAAGLHAGNLMVRGTRGEDEIVFALNAEDATKLIVTVNGEAREFELAKVRRIMVNAKAGNDLVSFNEDFGAITARAHLLGGPGHDTLFGASGNDKLHGGPGNDELHGGAGNDKLIGAAGNDMLFGDEGRDTLLGNGGSDTLSGGEGFDRIFGNAGKDVFDPLDDPAEIKDRSSTEVEEEEEEQQEEEPLGEPE